MSNDVREAADELAGAVRCYLENMGSSDAHPDDLADALTEYLTSTAQPSSDQSAALSVALETYAQEHSTCDIQKHPWTAVFGAGFEAGRATTAAPANAQPEDTEES